MNQRTMKGLQQDLCACRRLGNSRRRLLQLGGAPLALLLAVKWPAPAAARPLSEPSRVPGAQAVGVFTFLGDEVEMVLAANPAGSRLNRGGRQSMRIRDVRFDNTVLEVAREVLKSRRSAAQQQGYSPTSPLTEAETVELSDALAGRGAWPSWMRDAIAEDRLTELLIITREADDAALQTLNGKIGEGRVSGLGYYIDRHTGVRAVDGRLLYGYLGAYAYLRVSLVDVATGRVVGSEPVRSSQTVVHPEQATDRDPWTAVSPQQKIAALHSLLRDALPQALDRLLPAR